jgi:hypothetical protein
MNMFWSKKPFFQVWRRVCKSFIVLHSLTNVTSILRSDDKKSSWTSKKKMIDKEIKNETLLTSCEKVQS